MNTYFNDSRQVAKYSIHFYTHELNIENKNFYFPNHRVCKKLQYHCTCLTTSLLNIFCILQEGKILRQGN